MTRSERKKKVECKRMRVNKQRPTNGTPPTYSNFIGKPTPTYHMPSSLKKFLDKYATNNLLNKNSVTNVRKKKELERKTIVNGFTAFRIYYSKFGKTYKDQENLSKELATFWKSDKSIQHTWHGYSEEYKASDTKLSFVKWFDTYKSAIKVQTPPEESLTQCTKISHLIVEDVYNL